MGPGFRLHDETVHQIWSLHTVSKLSGHRGIDSIPVSMTRNLCQNNSEMGQTESESELKYLSPGHPEPAMGQAFRQVESGSILTW